MNTFIADVHNNVNKAGDMYDFTDYGKIRNKIFTSVEGAVNRRFPLENERHRLEVFDVHYPGKLDYSKKDQKKAILEGRSLTQPLKGKWRLVDKATGAVLSKTNTRILASVPYLTERGTFIRNGTETVMPIQARLVSGVYTRIKDNDEVEAHVNVKPGSGRLFKIFMDPSNSVFYMKQGTRNVKMYPLLKTLGVDDNTIKQAWGKDVFKSNIKAATGSDITKGLRALLPPVKDKEEKTVPDKTEVEKTPGVSSRVDPAPEAVEKEAGQTEEQMFMNAEETQRIKDMFDRMELDPISTEHTLGRPYSKVTPETLLRTTGKLIRVARKEQDSDARDSLLNQRFYTAPDILSEHILKDAGSVGRQLLWKISNSGDVKKIPTGVFNKYIDGVFNNSRIPQVIEEVNPLEIYQRNTAVTKMGEGGIGNVRSAPSSARLVQNTYKGFVDPSQTSESLKAGLTNQLAYGVKKGENGLLYTPLKNRGTGQTEWISTIKASQIPVLVPGGYKKGDKLATVMVGDTIEYMNPREIKYSVPSGDSMFALTSNMVPFKSNVHAQRLLMGSKHNTQALSLSQREAPLVQTDMGDGTSAEQAAGKLMGAVRAEQDGIVIKATPGKLSVKYRDGRTEDIDLYNNFPFNRKSYLRNTLNVKSGDTFKKGQTLAGSNYTDKDGASALGANLKVAYMVHHGKNYRDAVIVSESGAKKLTSEHMYSARLGEDSDNTVDKKNYMSMYPGNFNDKQYKTIKDDGTVKPGTVLHKGDPLLLSYRENPPTTGTMNRRTYSNKAVTWEHPFPGVVTDVAKNKNGHVVLVRANVPAQQGDKVCYDPETEILTDKGWKNVSDLTLDDYIATAPTDDFTLEYQQPEAVHRMPYKGKMYSLETTQVNLLTTEEHSQIAKKRYSSSYQHITSKDLFGKRYKLKKNAVWNGTQDQDSFMFPELEVLAGQSGNGVRTIPALSMPMNTYLALLGMFLAEGNIVDHPDSGTYGIDITQIKKHTVKQLLKQLEECGFTYSTHSRSTKYRIHGKQLMEYFKQFGKCWEKYIPDWVLQLPPKRLRVLYDWLMWGDGSATQTGHSYITTSKRLADDFQRLCLHIGYSANINTRSPKKGIIKGKEYDFRKCYDVRISRRKNEPTINHGHNKKQSGQTEQWVPYDGMVYCVTVPNHTVYTRRKGKTVWSGNCGRFGNKSVIAEVVPDSEMPRDKDGNVIDIAMSPLGIVSRLNDGQVYEALLGKVAAKRGTPYKIPGFLDQHSADYVEAELKKHGLTEGEDLIDPITGKTAKDITTGITHVLKLHHTAEGKGSQRSTGAYTQDEQPSTGGKEGAKTLGNLVLSAVVAHDALDVLKDMKLIKGQQNDDYWRQFKLGMNPAMPGTPLVYDKFLAHLKGAGISVNREGDTTNIFGMTERDARKMTGNHKVLSSDTYNAKNLEPIKGGLFDPDIFGKHGKGWGYLDVPFRIPNPVMEDPIKHILGLTGKQYTAALEGKHPIKGQQGPDAIYKALKKVNPVNEMEDAARDIRFGAKSKRDKAIKRYRALFAMSKHDVKPEDFMLSRIPVLPPKFRPVTAGGDLTMVADANYLYKNLMDEIRDYKEAKEANLPEDIVNSQRQKIYDSFKQVTGLTSPEHGKLKEKNVGGLLKWVFGKGSPKHGAFQRRVISTTMDMSGRSVVTPNSSLKLNEIGMPESQAWDLYEPFVIRNMVQSGYNATDAVKQVSKRSESARASLKEVIQKRPVIITRAPALHKYSVMGVWPKLTKGHTLQVPVPLVHPFNMDYDGDDQIGTVILAFSKENPNNPFVMGGNVCYNKLSGVNYDMNFWRDRRMSYMDLSLGVNKDDFDFFTMDLSEFPYLEDDFKGTSKDGKADFYGVPEGIKVVAYSERSGMPVLADVYTWSVHRNNEVCLVHLANGRTIYTDDDPRAVYGIDPVTMEFTRSRPGEADSIIVPCVRSTEHLYPGDVTEYKMHKCTGDTYGFVNVLQLNSDVGYFFGATAGDGWACHDKDKTVRYDFSSSIEEVTDRVKACTQMFFNTDITDKWGTFKTKDSHGESYTHRLACSSLAAIVARCNGRRAENKHLPPFWRRTSRSFRLGLLSGLLDTDGSVCILKGKKKHQLSASVNSNSLRLIRETQELLRSLGVNSTASFSKKTSKNKDNWILNISSVDLYGIKDDLMCAKPLIAESFAEAPGPREDSPGAVRMDRVPISPEQARLYADAEYAVCPKDTRKGKYGNKTTTLYAKLKNAQTRGHIARVMARELMVKFPDVPVTDEWVTIVSNTAVTWTSVKKTERTGRVETGYDLCVPGFETFMNTEGVILSNTASFYVPVSDDAVKETIEKMMPEKNLLGARKFKAHYLPEEEYRLGMFLATRTKKQKPKRKFNSKQEAVQAYKKGLIPIDEPVEITS